MSIDTPETLLIPRAEYLKSIIEACNNGAAAERAAIKDRLIELRDLTEPGSAVSIEITKWVNQIG